MRRAVRRIMIIIVVVDVQVGEVIYNRVDIYVVLVDVVVRGEEARRCANRVKTGIVRRLWRRVRVTRVIHNIRCGYVRKIFLSHCGCVRTWRRIV